MKDIFVFLFLCSGLRTGLGQKRKKFDVTRNLYEFKSTIYISSLGEGESGWWLASSNTDRGFSTEKTAIRDIKGKKRSQRNILDSSRPFRFQVVPCGQKYACIRNRYLEDENTYGGIGNYSKFDPTSFYMGIVYRKDKKGKKHWYVKMYYDTAEPLKKPNYLKWKIFCSHKNFGKGGKKTKESDSCNMYNKHLKTAMHLNTANGIEENSFFEMNRNNKNKHYSLKILKPRFRESKHKKMNISGKNKPIKINGVMQTSACNHATSAAQFFFSDEVGVSATKEVKTKLTASVSLEIKLGFEAEFKASFFGTGGGTKVTGEADSKISAGWEHSLTASETWTQTKATNIHIPVPPGKKVIITKLTGTYGTKAVPIYNIHAKDYNIYTVKCKV